MHQQPDDFKSIILVNGEPADLVSALDRGLHYGDGLFETIAVIDGKPVYWDRHLQRLKHGCDQLKLPAPDPVQLKIEAEELIKNFEKAVLKILYTRGTGGRGYRAPEPPFPTRILCLSPWPDYPVSHKQSGISLRICNQRLGNNQTLAGLKHLNRLEQVLARSEWSDPFVAEGLMKDQRGFVIEGTMSNVFFVQNKILYTPLLNHCGVSGIMRDVIMDLAEKIDIRTVIDDFTDEDIFSADELFMTNSLITIWPVKTVQTDNQIINYAAPGVITARLQSSLQN